jgi:hypothetical protein
MQRQDVPHYSREQVVDIIEDALLIVDEVAPPAELAVAVFDQAARMLSGKEIVMLQQAPIDLSKLRGNGLL